MGKKTKTPAAPDYTGIANQQAQQSKEAWNTQLQANRPNQTNQFGSSAWNQDPTTGEWTQSTQLNQPQQDIFNQQQANQQGIANAAGGMLGGLDTSQMDFSKAPGMGTVSDYSKLGNIPGQVDYSSLGQIPQVGQYNQQATDLYRQLGQPDLDRSQSARMANLAARGISDLNSGAGNNLMQQLGDQPNRFGMEAAQRGIAKGNTMFGQGMQGYQQGAQNLNNQWQQAMAGRQQGVKEMDTQFGQQNQLHQQVPQASSEQGFHQPSSQHTP